MFQHSEVIHPCSASLHHFVSTFRPDMIVDSTSLLIYNISTPKHVLSDQKWIEARMYL